MTFLSWSADMTPRSWAIVGVIAGVLGLLWCGAWLWWSVRKVKKDERPEGADKEW